MCVRNLSRRRVNKVSEKRTARQGRFGLPLEPDHSEGPDNASDMANPYLHTGGRNEAEKNSRLRRTVPVNIPGGLKRATEEIVR